MFDIHPVLTVVQKTKTPYEQSQIIAELANGQVTSNPNEARRTFNLSIKAAQTIQTDTWYRKCPDVAVRRPQSI